jgi:alpha-ketoglutarate-dependent taurine dioxygenase
MSFCDEDELTSKEWHNRYIYYLEGPNGLVFWRPSRQPGKEGEWVDVMPNWDDAAVAKQDAAKGMTTALMIAAQLCAVTRVDTTYRIESDYTCSGG